MKQAALLCLLLAGCDGNAVSNGTMVTPAEAPSPAIPLPTPAANAAITGDRIEKLPPEALAPPPATEPAAKMHPQKNFTDPPLPAELTDDGGLKPLPSPPPAR